MELLKNTNQFDQASFPQNLFFGLPSIKGLKVSRSLLKIWVRFARACLLTELARKSSEFQNKYRQTFFDIFAS